MIQVKTPVPPYAVTDGTYWPNGLGTIPLPVDFPNDGSTYIVVTISNASAGDSLDTLSFAGIDLISAPVPMVAADEDQSADDIVTEIDSTTSGSFMGTAASGGTSTVYRADLDENGSMGPLSFTATVSNGTVINIVATRWVIDEAGTFPDGCYYILDALDPGVNTVDPAYQAPSTTTMNPPSGPFPAWSPVTIAPGLWLYVPSTHTMHVVVQYQLMGGSGLSATFGTHAFVTLDPPLPSSISAPIPFRCMPGPVAGLRVENTGGAEGLFNGRPFPDGQVFDRSINPQMLKYPVTYDSTGTRYSIITNS